MLLLLVVVVIEPLYAPEIELNTSVYIILFIPRDPQVHVQVKALSRDISHIYVSTIKVLLCPTKCKLVQSIIDVITAICLELFVNQWILKLLL